MNYMQNIEDKDEFVAEIKRDISSRVFSEIEKKKQEIANDFLKAEEENESD